METSNLGRAFVDTNVLAHIVGRSVLGKSVVKTLTNANYEIVTASKCVYELYSLVKGTTKGGVEKKGHPLSYLLPPEINDIAQELFKKVSDIDATGNSYYWFNLSEQWEGWNYFSDMRENNNLIVNKPLYGDVFILLEKQKKFLTWKRGVREAFAKINESIQQQNIHVCEYFQIFSSDWYKKYGFFYEQDLSKDSLLPNEDFEIIMAALFLDAKIFVTEDDKGIIWRGGLSFDSNLPQLVFCCPERLDEAISHDFAFKFYSKRNENK